MSTPDTSPARLEEIKADFKQDGITTYSVPQLVIRDLLAMIEELKDQLDKAKEDIVREARGDGW
jgi:hypothetical protein